MLSWSNQLEFSHDFSDKLSAEIKSSVIRYKIDTYDYALLTGYLTDRLETSVFGGIYYEPTKKTQLSLQLRKDFISDSDAPLIFATGINYKPFEAEDLIFKANVSRNFHTPSLNDLYWQPGGNPNLRPEEGYSSELSAVYSRNFSKHILLENQGLDYVATRLQGLLGTFQCKECQIIRIGIHAGCELSY
jgi:outer membrane cobalamin receptor